MVRKCQQAPPAARRRWRGFVVAAVALFTFASPGAARAEDLFEIQVFHARVNPEGHPGVELHSNWVARGALRTPDGEASTQRVLYEMVEPTYGFARGWEIGAHFQQSFGPDGAPRWGGAKLRVMTLLPDAHGAALHLALNVEGGFQPAHIDRARWSTELRPVIEWVLGRFDLDFNPIIAFAWRGEHAGVPQLQPAVSARYTVGDAVAPGAEYYAQLGPVTGFPALRDQRHYVLATADVVLWPEWILHGGAGRGLTDASSHWVVTSIVGHIF